MSNAYKLVDVDVIGSVTFLLNESIFFAFIYGRLLVIGNEKMESIILAMFYALMCIE